MKSKMEEFKKHTMLEEISKYFEENGFNSATIQDISKYLGVSVGSLYKLFPSKEELYSAYIIYQRELFYTSLEEKCVNKEAIECLNIFVTHKFEVYTTKRLAVIDVLLQDPLFLMKFNLSNNDSRFSKIKVLEKWFSTVCQEKNLIEKDAAKLAYLFNALMNGYVEYWLNGGTLPTNTQEIVDNFLFPYFPQK